MDSQDLTANKCGSCGFQTLDDFKNCPKCGNRNWVKKELSGDAEVYSFTIIHVGFGEMADKTPYILALILLVEGYSVTTILNNISITEIKIGMKLKYKNHDAVLGYQFFHNNA